jgi:UDP-N-acetyl-D-glucosamine dehydrogenase
MEILANKGAIVDYNDPYIPELPEMRKYHFKQKSVALTKENLSSYDCVLISTDHSDYDWHFIVENSQLIVDTRNAASEVKENRHIIVKA